MFKSQQEKKITIFINLINLNQWLTDGTDIAVWTGGTGLGGKTCAWEVAAGAMPNGGGGTPVVGGLGIPGAIGIIKGGIIPAGGGICISIPTK